MSATAASATAAAGSRSRRRPGARLVAPLSARRGGVQVSEVQRARMLSSAVEVVSEFGYGRMSVARVTGRARVSRRTFYDLFEDREDCFLAVFDDALRRVTGLVAGAYEGEQKAVWAEKVRAGLTALLVFLDGEPGVCSLLVVDALAAGPRVLERRGRVLEGLGVAIQEGGARAQRGGRELSGLTGEGVVGAVFSVIHARVLTKSSGSLIELLSPLMGMIVLPYLGPAAARRELERSPAPVRSARVSTARGQEGSSPSSSSFSSLVGGDPLVGLAMRITYRTLRVLSAIGEHPGGSNRGVGDLSGITDQGQTSKLLTRLEGLGLIENTTMMGQDHRRGVHQRAGEPNAWSLTDLGKRVVEHLSLDTESHRDAT
jgi:AcrR family transcriptional regulator